MSDLASTAELERWLVWSVLYVALPCLCHLGSCCTHSHMYCHVQLQLSLPCQPLPLSLPQAASKTMVQVAAKQWEGAIELLPPMPLSSGTQEHPWLRKK